MFSEINNGWAKFNLLGFEGWASYMTDIIVDIGNMFIQKQGVVTVDEEGSTFDIILSSDGEFYIVSHRDKHRLYVDDDIVLDDIIKEYVKDLRDNFEKWIYWDDFEENEYLLQRKAQLSQIIENLS